MGIHDGHRERMKTRFREHGLDNFSDVNVLELLLFYAIPRRDTNELAHALLQHFKSLEAVLDASIEELEAVPGIGSGAATLIHLTQQLARRSAINRTRAIRTINSVEEAGRYLLPRLRYETEEKLLLLCLDSVGRILGCEEVASGVVNAMEISVRKVVETALKYRSSSVILAHNHPHGTALPSRADQLTTRSIYRALEMVDITLRDHLIITDDDYTSFAQSNLMSLMK